MPRCSGCVIGTLSANPSAASAFAVPRVSSIPQLIPILERVVSQLDLMFG